MAFFGMMEVLFLVVLSGNVPTDAVSFIPTAHYFKSRSFDVSIEKLMDLATTDPIDPKTHVMQLVAMKALIEDVANLKKSAKVGDHRKALEDIAAGTKAQDSAGFSKDYAARLLAALDGKMLPAPAELPARVYEDGLKWFPAKAQFVQAMDNRVGRNDTMVARFFAALQPLVPDKEKEQIYDVIEKIGNVELHRMAFAMYEEKAKIKPDDDKEKKIDERPEMEIYLRFTGRANRVWLAEFIAREDRGKVETVKGPGGEDLTYIKKEAGQPPAVVFIGSTEMLACGYERTGGERDNNKLLQQCLDVRAGKVDSVLKGPLAEQIKKLPNKAHGVIVGKVPGQFGRGVPFAFPTDIFGYASRTLQGQDMTVDLTMDDKDKATALVMLISQGRTAGLDALKKAQDNLPPNVNAAAIINTLESLQVQAKENIVNIRILVTDDAVMTLPALLLGVRALGG